MDIEALRTLWTVAEEGSITAAAGRLHLTQPAVSARLRSLERSLGTPLVERRGRRAVLTPPAERLLPYVRAVLAALDGGLHALQGALPMRIGATPTLASYLLPQVLRLACGGMDTPTVLRLGHPAELVENLFRRDVDVVLLRTPPHRRDLATEFLYAEPLAVAASPDHDLVGRRVDPDDLVRYPIVQPGRTSYCWTTAISFLRASGAEPRSVIDADHAVVGVLRAGLAIGFLPRFYAAEHFRAGCLTELDVAGFDPDAVRVPVFAAFRSFEDCRHLLPCVRQAAARVAAGGRNPPAGAAGGIAVGRGPTGRGVSGGTAEP